MQAVIRSGGKQYTVVEGQRLKLEKLAKQVGETIDFDQVLLVADNDSVQIGTPLLAAASVSAEVVNQGRHKKIQIIKMRRRKHYMRRQGHRQDYTEVEIKKISI